MSWAWEELRSTRLGDPRLELRLPRMIEDFAEHPEARIRGQLLTLDTFVTSQELTPGARF